MSIQFSCRITDKSLHCTITSNEDLKAPVFCCSGMAPLAVIEGGTQLTGTGGYAEIALPDLSACVTHEFTLIYQQGFTPANRAWMPLGPYLRSNNKLIEFSVDYSGYRSQSSASASVPSAALPPLRMVPQPLAWHSHNETVNIDGVAFNILAGHHDALTAVDELAKRRNFCQFNNPDSIEVTIKNESLPADAYRLTIAQDSIQITADSYGGQFYAGITLLSLMHNHNGKLPCGVIYDEPRFGWRGQHLDTARHFYQTRTIRDLLDLLALLKLNRFHWHFADDEAFRLELDCYPELCQKTRLRGEGHLLPALFSGATEAGGSYSKTDAQALIAHAKALNIEIQPEIEAPAHALAITRLYPETLDPDDTGDEVSVQGYTKNVLNPAMPATWEILNNIVKEVGSLFPFNHLHLGCDELPPDTWMGSPAAQRLMADEGLNSTEDLCGWTMSKLAATVTENGQRPCAWEEAARGSNGGIGHNAILFSWTGQSAGLEAAGKGYDVVMCPAQNVYLDMAHSSDTDDWGANWAAYISLKDTIAWNPVPEVDTAANIIGVQGAFWGEFTTKDEQMWPMLLPRILGIAVKAWQTDDISLEALESLSQYYRCGGLKLP